MQRHFVDAKVPIPRFARHQTENTLHPTRNTASIPTCPIILTEQKRLTIGTHVPGVEKKKPSKSTLRGSGTSCTVQESIEYLDKDYLTNRFFVTHYGGCAVLFNKDTLHPDIKVSSVYLHDTRDGQQQDVKGESGWVSQGVISRASFQRPRNGKSFTYDVLTHQQPICQETQKREKTTPYNPRCDAGRACGLGCWGLQRCRLAPPMRQRSNTHQYH